MFWFFKKSGPLNQLRMRPPHLPSHPLLLMFAMTAIAFSPAKLDIAGKAAGGVAFLSKWKSRWTP